MCKGIGCNRKDSCYRHTAVPNGKWQSWFAETPLDEHGDCKHFVKLNNKE